MIEMNKAKNEEIKGFLKWLEREIGTEIDTLANKTAIKEYQN
jgi:low affinity Fe/Cu permease